MPKSNKDKIAMTKKRIAFPIRLFEESTMPFQELPTEIHVVPTGKWDHPVYGEMEIGTSEIAKFVQHFRENIRLDLPITAGHDNGMNGGELPAVGWFKDVIDRGVNGLYAIVEWTEEGAQMLRKKAFKYLSPEFYETYEDPQSRERYDYVLVGAALTNSPYFKELDPVVTFSEPSIINQFSDESIMNIAEILAKDPSALTDEEKAFLVTNAADLTDGQKETFGIGESEDESADDKGDDAADEAGDEDTEGDDDEAKEDEAKEDEEDEEAEEEAPADKVEASDKLIKVSASEFAALKSKADEGASAFSELQSMKLDRKVSKLMFSTSNRDGRFMPKQKTALKAFMETLSDKQSDQFINVVNNMPKASLFSDLKGDDNIDEASAAKRIEKLVASEMEGKKLKYSDALRKVFKENPALEAEYNEEVV